MEQRKEIAIREATSLPGLPASAPKLDKRLATAVQSKISFRFTTDGEREFDSSRGVKEVVNQWDVPLNITTAMIAAAKREVPTWREYLRPARLGHIGEESTIADWLSQLGIMCAGQKMTVSEAKEKIVTYAPGLKYPSMCFTQASLYAAARHFKWFPTFSELCDWLDAIARPAKQTLERLEMLADAEPTPPKVVEHVKRWEDATREEREQHDRMMSDLRKRLATVGVGNSAEAAAARRKSHDMDAKQKAILAPMLEKKRREFMGEGEGED